VNEKIEINKNAMASEDRMRNAPKEPEAEEASASSSSSVIDNLAATPVSAPVSAVSHL